MHHHIHPGGSQMEKPYGYAEMTDPHPVTGQPGSRDDPQPPEGEGSGALYGYGTTNTVQIHNCKYK